MRTWLAARVSVSCWYSFDSCYVRWYSNGSNLSALNNRQEIEVYALPAK
jgi:hypothetical protein